MSSSRQGQVEERPAARHPSVSSAASRACSPQILLIAERSLRLSTVQSHSFAVHRAPLQNLPHRWLPLPAGRAPGVSYALQGSSADRIFNAFASLGSITLLFGNTVLLETQGTLRGEPSAVPPMLRAVLVAYTIIVALLVAVVVSGYWAFGAAVQPLVLDSITGPAWLLVAANLAVVVNSLAGYLVSCVE